MDTGSRPIMTYGEPAITGGSPAPKEFPSDRQMVRAVLSVHDRSEPPSGPILGEPAQTGSPRPRSLPRRAHHLASTYKFSHSNTAITVTFSESVQASSITSSTFVLKDPSNNTVTATVSYNDTTHAATLQPSSPLANSTTYTATISGAKDAAGNTMTGPFSWSFTTTDAPLAAKKKFSTV